MVVPGSGALVQVGPSACGVPQAERGARNLHLNVHSEVAGAPPIARGGWTSGSRWAFQAARGRERHGTAAPG